MATLKAFYVGAMNDAENEINELKQELKNAESAIESGQKDSQVLGRQMVNLQDQNEKLKATLANVKKVESQLRTELGRLQELRQENQQLAKNNVALGETLDEAKQKEAELRQELEQYKHGVSSELDEVMQELEKTKVQLSDAIKALEDAKAEAEGYKLQAEQNHDHMVARNQQIKELMNQVTDFQTKDSAQKAEVNQLQQKVLAFEAMETEKNYEIARLKVAELDVRDTEERIAKLQEALRSKDEQLRVSREEQAEMAHDVQELRTRSRSQDKELSRQALRLVDLEKQNKKLNAEKEKLAAENKSLAIENGNYKVNIRGLTNKLNRPLTNMSQQVHKLEEAKNKEIEELKANNAELEAKLKEARMKLLPRTPPKRPHKRQSDSTTVSCTSSVVDGEEKSPDQPAQSGDNKNEPQGEE